ncbi:MAG: hypothetical protein LUG45_05250 [Clostridiales bacterium]|nr:hypothetical protein [Clostridiales bacterium]
MVSLSVVNDLHRAGFPMPEVRAAVLAAEENGSADIGGYVVRYRQDTGEMILLHPSWNGIYTGDYAARLNFQKELLYSFGHYALIHAKHRELPAVLETLEQHKTNGFILCECDAAAFPRRKRQVEKLGYTVHTSNIAFCDCDWSPCYFLISPAG